jgi:DNA-binding GntR family transcriptional regulator
MVLSVPPDADVQARSESAKQRVYRQLKADIVRGVFDMGERLNEGQLASRYDVGKTPVREALGVLQQEGLVEVLPRVGYLTSRVTLQDVDDIFDLRKIVEGAAAEKAATAIGQETLERLEQLPLEFRAGDRESYLRFLEENLEFHSIIAESTGNRRLAGIVAGLLEQMQRLVILRLDISGSLEELVDEHANLLAAFRDGDPARARLHMVTDIANTHQAALDSLKKLMANRHI